MQCPANIGEQPYLYGVSLFENVLSGAAGTGKRRLVETRGPLAERISVGCTLLTVHGLKRVRGSQDRTTIQDLASASAAATG
jgi:hypothetical protein